MIAKTQVQKEAEALAFDLPRLPQSTKEWAIKKLFEKEGWATERKVTCLCCGAEFKSDKKDYQYCPVCGKRLHIRRVQRRRGKDRVYFNVLDVVKNYQIVRTFIVERNVSGSNVSYDFYECIQAFIRTDGKSCVRSLPIIPLTYDFWIRGRQLETRNSKLEERSKYMVDSWVAPHGRLHRIVRRNGASIRLLNECRVPQAVLLGRLINDPISEMLAKNGQVSLLKMRNTGVWREEYNPIIKICNRRKYVVKDASMWFDLLNFLSHLSKDVHSPKYICPPDLHEAHDKWMNKHREALEKEKIAKDREQAVRYEREYGKKIAPFLAFVVKSDGIVIRPISTVVEMAEEGAIMHHCVYDARYYSRPDALILSARKESGERLETIEVNLKSFEVVQSRGCCNKPTSAHDEIVGLMKKNVGRLKKMAKSV